MPIVATPVTPTAPITADDVRLFMIDYPDCNILIDTVEFTQEQIDAGLCMTVSKYNSITPITSLTVESFPLTHKYLLILGTAAYLLKSCALKQLRNQATVQDGDIAPIGIDDKMPQYLQMAQVFSQEFDGLVKKVKIQNNMDCAYGTVSSGYVNVYRYNRV